VAELESAPHLVHKSPHAAVGLVQTIAAEASGAGRETIDKWMLAFELVLAAEKFVVEDRQTAYEGDVLEGLWLEETVRRESETTERGFLVDKVVLH
jgi:hypothetical protein